MTHHHSQDTKTVYTIGHSNHDLGHFLNLLGTHEIDVVADTRSSPRSRFVPHFNRDALQQALEAENIDYWFLGGELGGRPADPTLYDEDGHALYFKIARTEPFHAGIERVVQTQSMHRIALLCSEEDPSVCHRRLLVARVLRERGVRVMHLRGNGALQSEDELITAETAGHQPTLFGEPEPRAWKSLLPIARRS